MIKSKIVEAPKWTMFAVFFSYGGLLTLTLTVFYWEWSGPASLGVFYLMFLAPIIMLLCAYKQYKIRAISNYHKWLFYFSMGYFILAPLTFFIVFHFSKN